MSNRPQPLILANTVGLTDRLLQHAPRLQRLANSGWKARLREVTPAVTSTAQATLLTGSLPCEHGIVANGWLFRDTMEVRFWQQSNRLLEREPLYVTARRRATKRGIDFSAMKLFWWFNQGAAVDFSVTPKPHYGADGNKRFAVASVPEDLARRAEKALGRFPFPAFWGPNAGLASTHWIARAVDFLLQALKPSPDLTLVYLPHLDYDLQRFGVDDHRAVHCVRELDDQLAALGLAAQKFGGRLWVVNEYSHATVSRPVFPNRALREAGLLTVRDGPFGETLETFQSAVFAVCDHQIAHVYIKSTTEQSLRQRVRELLARLPGVATVLDDQSKAEHGLDHPRSGELILLAERDAWFAYPYWLDDRRAPDFARCVDIHRKPGFDPCELFFDPKLWWPKGRAAWRLMQKTLGFRTLFDVVPLDASLVRGSHGLAACDPRDRPLLIGSGPKPYLDGDESLPMTAVRDLVLAALGLHD